MLAVLKSHYIQRVSLAAAPLWNRTYPIWATVYFACEVNFTNPLLCFDEDSYADYRILAAIVSLLISHCLSLSWPRRDIFNARLILINMENVHRTIDIPDLVC